MQADFLPVPDVSVIMPVYKVERFVARALESVCAQTLTTWELLVVDDGSPDQSGAICDEYAKRNNKIKVFHRENEGAPAARNFALTKACGRYVFFMDSDDWIEPQTLAKLLSCAARTNRELVICGFYIDTYYDSQNHLTQTLSFPQAVFETQKDFRHTAHKLFDKNLLYTPWNKLFLRSYLEENKLRFPQTFWDDFPFVLSVIRDIKHVAVIPDPLYHFIRARAESETARYRPEMYERREEEHGWLIDLYAHWHLWNKEVAEFIYRRYIERVVGCVENVCNPASQLSAREKKAKIAEMLASPEVKKALHTARPHSMLMRVMLLPFKWRSIRLIYLEGMFISWVKSHDTKLFSKLKAKR